MNLKAQIHGLFFENAALKGAAFIVTLVLFVWVRDDREATVVATAPVRIVIPEGMVMVTSPVDRVRLTVRGRWSDVSRFDPTELQAVTLEATGEREQTLSISEDAVILPGSLQVVTIQPEMIRLQLEPQERRIVRIQPRIVGQPKEAYRIGAVVVNPPEIEFSGPKNIIDDMEAVWTEPIDVSEISESIQRRVQLRPESPLVAFDANVNVSVRIPIETLEVTRTIQDIEIAAVNTTKDVVMRPPVISATVRGPKSMVDNTRKDQIMATIDLSAEERRGPGTFEKQPQIKNLPEGLTLVDFHPKDIIVTTTRPDPPRPEE